METIMAAILITFFVLFIMIIIIKNIFDNKIDFVMEKVKKCFDSQIELDNDIMDLLSKKKNIKEEYLSVKNFVKLISDGSLSEETGHGGFIFEDDSEEPINWDYIRCICSTVSKKYNQDCLCDIDKDHINDAFREVEEYICEWKNSNESTVYEIRWIWENI